MFGSAIYTDITLWHGIRIIVKLYINGLVAVVFIIFHFSLFLEIIFVLHELWDLGVILYVACSHVMYFLKGNSYVRK